MSGPDPNFVATIYANNQKFTAWESVMVQREFGVGVSTFNFTAAEGYYGQRMLGLQIAPGDPVTIALAGQLAFTGYAMTRAVAFDKSSHQVVIAGISRTFDLSHSSVVVQPGTFDGSTFEQAARSVIAPHNINLVMANPPPGADQPFTNLATQYGEKCSEFVNRTAAARNLFISDNANGDLVVGHAAPDIPVSVTLTEGKNILRCSAKINDPAAYSWAKLQGVSQTRGTDDHWPPRANSATATYTAARPNSYALFVAEHPDDAQGLVTALTHQAIRSAWPEIEIEVTVIGWLRPDGKLWATAPDDSCKVSLYSPLVFPNASGSAILGIQAVRFEQSTDGGTTTTLTLRRWELLTHAKAAGTSDAGANNALPSVSVDGPDWV